MKKKDKINEKEHLKWREKEEQPALAKIWPRFSNRAMLTRCTHHFCVVVIPFTHLWRETLSSFKSSPRPCSSPCPPSKVQFLSSCSL